MKKSILFLLGFVVTLLTAGNIEREIGINIGLNSTKNKHGFKFKNPTVGVMYQDNGYMVMPRVDLDYTKVNNDYASSLLKGSVNAVYEYENRTNTTPYVLAGVGYEYVIGATQNVFESHPFVQAGVGVKIDLEQGYKARVEGKMLQVLGGSNEGDEAIVTAGLSYPFAYIQKRVQKPRVTQIIKKTPPIRTRVKPRYKRVIHPKRVRLQRVIPVRTVPSVDRHECSIKINGFDSDRDGIENRFDQCSKTPCYFSVNSYGCPIKTTLKINFRKNSANIEGYSLKKIEVFANFLLKHKGSFVRIVGHSDSFGSKKHNLHLSARRANAVVRALISRGVSKGRLRAEARGESEPIASNKTSIGRAKNRRIEAVLSYPRERR